MQSTAAMKTSGVSASRLVAVITSALAAAAIIALAIHRDRSGDGSVSPEARPEANPAASVAPPERADAGAAPGGDVPLQPLDLGNLDEVPWKYRDRADEEAARRAAIERVRRRAGSETIAIEPDGTQASEAAPITGDGPESGRSSPAIAALPGPGEVTDGERRTGPSLPPGGVLHAPPEAGGLRRPSAGPALPGVPAEPQTGPELAPADPDAPGPGA